MTALSAVPNDMSKLEQLVFQALREESQVAASVAAMVALIVEAYHEHISDQSADTTYERWVQVWTDARNTYHGTKLPTDIRRSIVAGVKLEVSGISTYMLGAALGVNHAQISRDTTSAVCTSDTTPATEQPTAPRMVTGADGRMQRAVQGRGTDDLDGEPDTDYAPRKNQSWITWGVEWDRTLHEAERAINKIRALILDGVDKFPQEAYAGYVQDYDHLIDRLQYEREKL